MTKREKFMAIKEYLEMCEMDDADQKDMFLTTIQHEIDLLDKKQTASKTDTFAARFRDEILHIISHTDSAFRASDFLVEPSLLALCEEANVPLRIQRVTSALTALCDNKVVKRAVAKGTAYFSRANPEQTAEGEGE